MYQDGLLLDLAWTGNKSFKIMAKARLENVAEQPYHGFFPIVTDDHMNLFFGNKSKSGVLYNQYLERTMIPNSTIPKQFCRDASMVHVGKLFWVLGGSHPCVGGQHLITSPFSIFNANFIPFRDGTMDISSIFIVEIKFLSIVVLGQEKMDTWT